MADGLWLCDLKRLSGMQCFVMIQRSWVWTPVGTNLGVHSLSVILKTKNIQTKWNWPVYNAIGLPHFWLQICIQHPINVSIVDANCTHSIVNWTIFHQFPSVLFTYIYTHWCLTQNAKYLPISHLQILHSVFPSIALHLYFNKGHKFYFHLKCDEFSPLLMDVNIPAC